MYDKLGINGTVEKEENRKGDARVDKREQWTEFTRPKRKGATRKVNFGLMHYNLI